MKKIAVEIKGVSSLLHNRFPIESFGINETKLKKKVYIPENEAEKLLYKNSEGIYHPSEHILGALIKAGANFKYEGRKTFKDPIKAGVVVEPENIPLLGENGVQKQKWDEIDARGVVIQRARVVKWRPKFNNWILRFFITIINDDEISINTIKDILEYSGKFGIGDYRPRFGRFMITSFQEVN